MAASSALAGERLTLVDPAPAEPSRRWWPALPGLVILLLAAVAGAASLLDVVLAERREALSTATQARLQALAHGRAEVLGTWLDGVAALGRRITRSELVQLYALELALSGPGRPLPSELAEQRPYMRQLLDDLAQQGELVGAYLVSADGRLLLADSAAPTITPGQLAEAALVAGGTASRRIAAAEPTDGHLWLDLRLALPVPQPDLAGSSAGGAALVLRLAADQRVEQLLDRGPLDHADAGIRLRLDDGTLIERGTGGRLERVAAPLAAPSRFEVRAPIAQLGWAIEQSVPEATALLPLAELGRSMVLAALAGSLLLALAVGGGWWWLTSRHQREMLAQYRGLTSRLRQQHGLLQGIMAAVPDLIGLKTASGSYAFANRALATALELPAEDIVGRSDAELLPAETAAALRRLDGEAAAFGLASLDELEVRLAGRCRHLSIVVAPLMGDEAAVGSVVIARDVSEPVAHRRQRRRWVEQTIAALAKAIELADPYLCGHSQRMSRLAGAIAEQLGLDAAEVATVRIASTLSQIGKLFVPREILTKPGRHDAAERQAMRRHVDHAQMVLRGIDLGLPVAAALGQMHERLDGTGYPLRLAGAAISMPARVLAIADVFCARTTPRSYRDAIPAASAIAHLRDNPGRYDRRAIAALETVWARDGDRLGAS